MLEGKTILITGATSGIGKRFSTVALNSGANLILVGRNERNLELLKSELSNPACRYLLVDIENADTVYSQITEFLTNNKIKLDAIFHSAGIELIRPLKLITQSQIDVVFGPSIYGFLGLLRLVSNKKYFNDHGSVVVMSSVSAHRGKEYMGVYSASKAAIDAAVRSSSIELSKRNIRVNSVVSGAIQTEMHNRISNNMSDDSLIKYCSEHPLGFGETDDIANFVQYLMSANGKWITGSCFQIDGGYLA